MDIASFLLGIVSDIAKSWIVDLVRGEKEKKLSEKQFKAIQDLIDQKLNNLSSQSVPSSESLARSVVEQIIVMSHKPDFPISIADERILLKDPPSRQPRLGSPDKWADKEISSRLYKLENAIRERYLEISNNQIALDNKNNSSNKPDTIILKTKLPLITKSDETNDFDTWNKKLEKTSEQIEKRRQNELKTILLKNTEEGNADNSKNS